MITHTSLCDIYLFGKYVVRQKESQRVQREAALAQHEQLDAMLRRQADHRRQMQAIISSHQERITQRIKVEFIVLIGNSLHPYSLFHNDSQCKHEKE